MNIISGSDPGAMTLSEGKLLVKTIITTEDQDVEVRVAIHFSWKLWFNNIFRNGYGGMFQARFVQFQLRDPDTGKLNCSWSLGNYEVYKPLPIPKGTKFRMFDLAITSLNANSLLSTYPDFKYPIMIRQCAGGPKFEYAEIDEW